MKTISIMFTAMLLCISMVVRAEDALWTKVWGTGEPDHMLTDDTGNIYVSGYYFDELNIQGEYITNNQGFAAYLAKFSPDGTLLWLSNMTATGGIYLFGMSMDNDGNILVTGGALGLLNLGGSLAGNESDNYGRGYVGVYNGDGVCTMIGGTNGETDVYFINATQDNEGNYFVTGIFSESFYFGATEVTHYDESDALVCSFDSDMNPMWSKSIGGTGDDAALNIAIDNDDNIIISGFFSSTYLFEEYFFPNLGYEDLFVLKMEHDGTIIWVKTFGSAESEGQYNCSLALDEAGDVYFGGTMGEVMTHPGGTTNSYGGSDFFVTKLDKLYGVSDWFQHGGGAEDDAAFGMILGNNDNLYLFGYFLGAAEIDGLQLLADTDVDGFYAELNRNGGANLVWQTDGDNAEVVTSLSVDAYNNVVVGGAFDSNIHFEGVGDFNAGAFDFSSFIVKMETQYTLPETAIQQIADPVPMQVYPNPVADLLHIEWDAYQNSGYAIAIVDMSGRVVLQQLMENATQCTVDLHGVPAGAYQVSVLSDGNAILCSEHIQVIH